MSRKITRRVVLGTLIGGLVAGPFVVQALGRKPMQAFGGITGDTPPTDVPSLMRNCPAQRQLFQEWETYNNMFNVPIAEQKKLDAFFTPHRLPVDFKANFTSINAEVMGNIER